MLALSPLITIYLVIKQTVSRRVYTFVRKIELSSKNNTFDWINYFKQLQQFYSTIESHFMFKKKGQLGLKNALSRNNTNQKSFLDCFQNKQFLKSCTRLLSNKPQILGVTQPVKVTKSRLASPYSKITNHSRQNFHYSAFSSKKSTETISPYDYDREPNKTRTKNDFNLLFQIGSGGFGRVWKAEQKKTKSIFAMKQMSKAKIITKKSVSSIMNEKQLLDQLNNPFIINSCGNFQDREHLYLLMQYLRGGDLRYHMCFYETFNEQQTKFIVGCIILALEYIHANNIIHRDLKPENIVFEETGYVRITDFGVARRKREENSQDTSGTPGYMSPEVICRMNHSFEADFFALGVIVFELIYGIRPYYGDTRKQIRQKILAQQAKIYQKQLPAGWSTHCMDFVNGLLKRNRQNRLGYKGISQLKNHPWLKSLHWSKLARKQITPPFRPGIICESRDYQKQMESTMPSEVNEDASILLRTAQIQKLFRNYDIVCKKRNRKMKLIQSHRSSFNKKIL